MQSNMGTIGCVGLSMKIGDLVQSKVDNTIGVVNGINKPMVRGGVWYYLIYWSNGESDYYSQGLLQKLEIK